MATNLMGPLLVAKALSAAPVPRPPQPTRATWTSPLPAAWTCGIATPAKAEAAAMRLVALMNSRRVVRELEDSFIMRDHREGAEEMSMQEMQAVVVNF